jgi:hypothetical protein
MPKPKDRIARENPEIRQELIDLMSDGYTYDECVEYCRNKGYDFSRSAIGRLGAKHFELMSESRQLAESAKFMKMSPGDALLVDDMICSQIQQKLYRLIQSDEIDLTESHALIGQLARLQDSSTRREKFRSDLEDKKARAVEKVTDIAKKGGLSDEVISTIRQQIMGIAA